VKKQQEFGKINWKSSFPFPPPQKYICLANSNILKFKNSEKFAPNYFSVPHLYPSPSPHQNSAKPQKYSEIGDPCG
jgi:hypothetical protein